MPVPYLVGTPTTSHNTDGSNTGDSLSVAAPTGMQSGDVVLVSIRSQSSTSPTDFSCSGFSRVGPAFTANSANNRVLGFYLKVITTPGSEPASYTFTKPSGGGRGVIIASLFRGVDNSNPISGYRDSYSGPVDVNDSTKCLLPSFNITSPCLVVTSFSNELSSGNANNPVDYSPELSLVSQMATPGDTTVSRTILRVGTYSSASDTSTLQFYCKWSAVSSVSSEGIALRGVSDPAPVDPKPNYRPFNNVSDMLRNIGFTWAHRGNSALYSEMSSYSYLLAMSRGFAALEISLAKSSDGVWFGLHDQYLDRTAGITGNVLPSSKTWAEIQALPNIGVDGVDRGYLRWEDFVELSGSCILIVDPKWTISGGLAQFWELISSVPKSRVIVKFSYDYTTLATQANSRGYSSWGFLYSNNLSDVNFDSLTAPWTMLGFPYEAPQGEWNTVLAKGKPVIAHIAASVDNYNTALSKGAVGVQCSGSNVIPGVGKYLFDDSSNLDQTINWLRGLGYTGTLQDMQFKFLKDQPGVILGSSSDMQKSLNKKPRDVLRRIDWL